MPDILIQFHALREELLPLVKESTSEFGLHVTVIRHSPFEAKELNLNDLAQIVSESSPFDEVVLTLETPVLPASRGGEFADRNPDKLRLRMGRKTQKGLEESGLTARTSNPVALAVWKKVANRLKSMTQAGAVAINPDSKATANLRNHRFTPKAKELESQGVSILPVAGGSILRLGKPKT